MHLTNRLVGAALLAIVMLASCAASRGSAEKRKETREVVDPTAGTITYKGRTIVFDEAAEPPLLTIDGKPIKVFRSRDASDGGHTKYGSSATTYVDFTSLWQLARGVIDTAVPGY